MADLKWLNLDQTIRLAFSWNSDADKKSIGSSFFLAHMIGGVIESSLFMLGAMLAITFFFPQLSTTLAKVSGTSWIAGGVLGLVATIALTVGLGAATYFIFKRLGWFDERKHGKLFGKVLNLRLLVVAIYVVAFIIVFIPSVQTIKTILNSATDASGMLSQAAALLLAPQGIAVIAAVLSGIVIFAVGWILWAYVFGYFLMANVLRLAGVKSRFVEVNLKNVINYLKFTIVIAVTLLFNYVSKKMMKIQLGLIILLIGSIVAGLALSASGAMIVAAIIAFIVFAMYSVTVAYNTYRFSVAAWAFMTRKDGAATPALKESWEMTRGYVVSIAIIYFVIGIIVGLISLLLTLPAGALGLVSDSIPLLTPVWSAADTVTSALTFTVTMFTTTLMAASIYSQLREASGRKKLIFK